jgi:hypothetical protein
MSNLSQFFSGGAPVKISRGTTSYSYNLSGGITEQTVNRSDLDTGVIASPVDRAFITQGQKANHCTIYSNFITNYFFICPKCAAFIGTDDKVKISRGGMAWGGQSGNSGGSTGAITGTVMWWLVQYD